MKSCWVGCGGWRIRKFWKRGRNTLYQPSLHLSNNELYAFFSGKGDLLKIIYNAQLPPLESTTGCGISKHDYWYLITVSLTSSQISWLHMRLRRSLTSIQTAVIDDRAASVASRWQSVNNPLSNVIDRRKHPECSTSRTVQILTKMPCFHLLFSWSCLFFLRFRK